MISDLGFRPNWIIYWKSGIGLLRMILFWVSYFFCSVLIFDVYLSSGLKRIIVKLGRKHSGCLSLMCMQYLFFVFLLLYFEFECPLKLYRYVIFRNWIFVAFDFHYDRSFWSKFDFKNCVCGSIKTLFSQPSVIFHSGVLMGIIALDYDETVQNRSSHMRDKHPWSSITS